MKVKTTWKWFLIGGLSGYGVLHPLVMITAHFMSEPESGHAISGIIVAEVVMSFSREMLPWSLAFALFGAFIGFFYGKIRQVEAALRESEERFRSMAAAAQDAMILADGRGNISYWNAAAERIFGYRQEEAIGSQLRTLLVPQRYHQAHQKALAAFKSAGRLPAIGKALDVSALRKDGTEFPAEISLSSVKLQGELHALGIMRDVSERKLAEEERLQAEKMQGVLEMAGAACHELNQPLQVISACSELLLEDIPENHPSHGDLKTIKKHLDIMEKITKKIMRITTYETREYVGGAKIIDIDKASKTL